MRLLLVPPLVLAGLVTGVASTGLHDRSWGWFLLAVAAPVATLLALRPGSWRVGFAAGWVPVVALAASGGPGGDYAVAGGGRGYALLGVTLVVVVLALATVPVGRRAAVVEPEPRGPGS